MLVQVITEDVGDGLCETVYFVAGEEARKLFDDAQRMLSDVVNSGLLHCAGVVGFWRANSVGDDIEVYDNDGCVVATFYGLRQQVICQHLPLLRKFVFVFVHLLVSLSVQLLRIL